MTSRITPMDSTRSGRMLLNFVINQMAALGQGRRILAILNSAQFGNPADWAAVATELGLVGPTREADAQAAWAIVSNVMSIIDVATVAELSRMDQG